MQVDRIQGKIEVYVIQLLEKVWYTGGSGVNKGNYTAGSGVNSGAYTGGSGANTGAKRQLLLPATCYSR